MKQGELRKRLRSKRWRQRIEVEHSSIYVALRALALPLLGITTCVALPPGRVEVSCADAVTSRLKFLF
ncbi:hypothetical protein RB195_019751 [Necator americanus]|uniref:Uncharacterized protein n=1 Tax=Necator americanus TaxID=51031 RepID=A0ABR1CFP7_NECAM